MKKLKQITALILCVAMTLAMSACAGNANSTSTPSSSAAPSAPAKTGVVVAAASLGNTLNPWDQTDATTSAFEYSVYDRLVKYASTTDKNGHLVADTSKLEGNLAKSWETSEDGLVWTFHLNPAATFTSGNKVTSADVIWSFEHCRDNANSSFFFTLTNITDMKAPDDQTVVLTLSQRCNMFLRLLEIYSFCIVDKAAAEKGIAGNPDFLTTNACGSGPYEITSYDTTKSVVLASRGDAYWGDEKAKNSSVTYELVPEASNRQMLLENGDVDIALDLDEKNIATVSAEKGITVIQNASNKHLFLCMNNNVAPFDNVKVRQAVACLIPYDDLVNEIMSGNAVRTTSMLPDNVSGHISDDKTCYQTNVEKAKELLTEAGYPNGFDCTMTLGNGFTDWEESAVAIQAALKQVNINMTINEMDRAAFLSEAAKRNLQIFINRFNPFIGDPGYLVNCMYTQSSSYNYFNYHNDKFDELYKKAEAAATEEERLSIYKEMQYIFAEDCPVAEMYQYSFSYCGRDNVSGFVYYPDGTLRFQYLSIS